jgi:hypothetical protein
MAANLLYGKRSEQFNPLAAGAWWEQRHFDSVSVVSSYSHMTCQPATATESRCFSNVTAQHEATRNSSTTRRAEPLERPCSFALPASASSQSGIAESRLQRYRMWLYLHRLYNGQSTTRLKPDNRRGRAVAEAICAQSKRLYRLTHKRPFRRDTDFHGLNKVAGDAETGATQAEQIARAKSRKNSPQNSETGEPLRPES